MICTRSFSCLFVLILILSACSQAQMEPDEMPSSIGQWETLATADSPNHRHENGYVASDGLFYLVGGRGQRPVDVFDPEALTWTEGSAPPFQMHHFQAIAYQGKIYVMGAFTGGFPLEDPIPNIYIYDPATDEWTMGPEIPEDRRRGAAGAVVHNNKFYMVSGIQFGHSHGHVTWFDEYDPATDEWTQLPDAPRARDHFMAAVIDGKLYAAGGRRSSHATGETADLTEAEVDVFDFASGTWSTISNPLPTERAGSTTAVLNSELIIIGGESVRRPAGTNPGDPIPAHDEVEAYNPATGTWRSLAPMIEGRHATQAIVYNGKIYMAAGSRTLGGTEIDSQEVFSFE